MISPFIASTVQASASTATWSANDATLATYDTELTCAWRFDNGSLLADSKGSNTLTNNNTVTNDSSGKNGYCSSFVASSSQDLSINDNADISPTTGMAISLWFYGDDTDTVSRGFLWKDQSYYLFKWADDNDKLGFVLYDGNTNILNNVACPARAWTHIMAIADGTANRQYLYVNNAESAGAENSFDATIVDNGNVLRIGQQGGSYFDGRLDEIYLWKNPSWADNATRQAFVSALYNSGTGAFYQG